METLGPGTLPPDAHESWKHTAHPGRFGTREPVTASAFWIDVQSALDSPRDKGERGFASIVLSCCVTEDAHLVDRWPQCPLTRPLLHSGNYVAFTRSWTRPERQESIFTSIWGAVVQLPNLLPSFLSFYQSLIVSFLPSFLPSFLFIFEEPSVAHIQD